MVDPSTVLRAGFLDYPGHEAWRWVTTIRYEQDILRPWQKGNAIGRDLLQWTIVLCYLKTSLDPDSVRLVELWVLRIIRR